MPGTWTVYAVAYYTHEDEHNRGKRYSVKSASMVVTNETVYPHVEGYPVAIEWFVSTAVSPLGMDSVKLCGEKPSAVYPSIFSHGFEGGSTKGWSRVVP